MLTAEFVNARRRGDELRLIALDDDARSRALTLAQGLVATVTRHVGRPHAELISALGSADVPPRDVRMRDGFAKLLEDRCVFGPPSSLDPGVLRRDVFVRASAKRAALLTGEPFDRLTVLSDVALARGTTPEEIERGLFADLRGAQLLVSFEPIRADSLVEAYERGQAQAVLLRAVKITVDLRAARVLAVRAFFRKLKFLRLLYAIAKTDEGYRIVIDGPFSLFESATKYGLQLALVLPALEACPAWRLEAEIRWGKEKRPLLFRLEGQSSARSSRSPLPAEVLALMRSFEALGTAWRVLENDAVIDLKGVGLTVPDLVFETDGAPGMTSRVYLEVMGYWSRAAVWQRVELVRAGLGECVLFAVSSRLRVSEEILDSTLPSALYVYKGTMSARVIAERLEGLRVAADERATRATEASIASVAPSKRRQRPPR